MNIRIVTNTVPSHCPWKLAKPANVADLSKIFPCFGCPYSTIETKPKPHPQQAQDGRLSQMSKAPASLAVKIKGLFTDHPRAVGESYLEHWRFATKFSGKCFMAGVAASIHSIFPFMFKTTASEIIAEIGKLLENHGRDQPSALKPQTK